MDGVNGQNIETIEGILEDNEYSVGTIVQLERIGYAIIEDGSHGP